MDVTENYRIDANFRWFGNAIKANEELYLMECGIEQCKKDKIYGPTVRDEYHVHCILHGKGTLEMNGVSYSLQRGQIFVIMPGVKHVYYADPRDPWHYAWISFSGTRAAYFLERAGITPEHPIRSAYGEPERFLAFIENILNHHQLTAANELTRISQLYGMLALLVDSQSRETTPSREKTNYDYSPDIYVNSAVEYIHEHYHQISVGDIASYIGISRYYLSHIFKEKLHVSPQEYLMNYRMEQSARLLRTTGLSIQEVAGQAGYNNPLTFSKVFKNAYGLSPKNYRLKILAEAKSEDTEASEG